MMKLFATLALSATVSAAPVVQAVSVAPTNYFDFNIYAENLNITPTQQNGTYDAIMCPSGIMFYTVKPTDDYEYAVSPLLKKDDVVHPDRAKRLSAWEYTRLLGIEADYTVDGLSAIYCEPEDVRQYWNKFWWIYEEHTSQEDALYEIDLLKSIYNENYIEVGCVAGIVQDYVNFYNVELSAEELVQIEQDTINRYIANYGDENVLAWDREDDN